MYEPLEVVKCEKYVVMYKIANKMRKMPEELKRKYPTTGALKFPKTDKYADEKYVEVVKRLDGVFVEDSNPSREYWKGFELIEWEDGTRELRFCYWTRKRGTESWKWGRFNPIISFNKLKQLVDMINKKDWFTRK